MLDELTTASDLLQVALDRYSNACLDIQKAYTSGANLYKSSPQLRLRMHAEVEHIISLESKLAKTKAVVGWLRNRSCTHVTMNDIPPEILAYIFHLVLSGRQAQPCANRDYHEIDKSIDIMYPAALSRVCSRWRSVASSNPRLWVHIDISTWSLLNRQHLNRLAKLHLDHAGQSPLHLHIFGPPGCESDRSIDREVKDRIVESITRFAGRTSSFNMDELATAGPGDYQKFLSALFQRITPGSLTQFALRSTYTYYFSGGRGFLKANGDPEPDRTGMNLSMDLPWVQFESILSHITVLRLAGPYPRWASRAYHGLVELRLAGWEKINESDLVGILRSSPNLRILHLGLQIEKLLPIDTCISPIPLEDLEVLIMWPMSCALLPSLLRWLVPGSSPLQFALATQDSVDTWSNPALGFNEAGLLSFLSHAWLTRVCGKRTSVKSAIRLLELSPSIEELSISHTSFGRFPPLEDGSIGSTLEHHLRYFQIAHSSVDLEAIVGLLSIPTFTVETIIFHDCCILYHNVEVSDQQVMLQLEELRSSCPDVKFIVRSLKDPYLVNLDVASWGPDPLFTY